MASPPAPLTHHIALLAPARRGGPNAYVVREDGGHTLVDPGPPASARRILALDRRGALHLVRVLLTHGHPAHAGAAARVVRGTGIPAFVHADDAPWVDGRRSARLGGGPPLYRVAPLAAGAPTGALLPIATPGHTRGHLCLLHVGDGAVLSGDALLTDGDRCVPPRSASRAETRAAAAALLAHRFDALLPGHGPPLLTGARGAVERLWRSMRD